MVASNLGSPALKERERKTVLYRTAVMPYACMPPPPFPWPCAGDDKRCESRTRRGKGRAATGDVAAAGRGWQGPRFGQPPWTSAVRAARAGCHASEGSAGAGNSCLLAFASAPSAQHGSMSPECFWWGGSSTAQPHFPCIREAREAPW